MKKMILEARTNEYAMRDENPHVPWTSDEIAESAARCREAGQASCTFMPASWTDRRNIRSRSMPTSFVRFERNVTF